MQDASASRGRHAHALRWEPHGKEATPAQEILEALTMQPVKPLEEVTELWLGAYPKAKRRGRASFHTLHMPAHRKTEVMRSKNHCFSPGSVFFSLCSPFPSITQQEQGL